MKADSIWSVILRVIQRSERSSSPLISGMIWRIAERLLDVLPMLVCFWWLQAVLMADVGDSSEVTPSLVMITALLVAIFALQLFCAIHGQKNCFLGTYSIMGGYREKLLDRVHQLPLGALYRYRTGQLTDMVTDDVLRIENIFTHLVIEVLTTLLIPVVLVAGLMWVDWQLALSLIIGIPCAFWVLLATRKLFVRMSQDKQAEYRDTSGLIVEFVTGIKTLRLYHRAELWLTKLYRHFDEMIRMSIKVEQWGAVPVMLYRLLLELGLVVFFLIAANKIDADSASPLTLLLFMLLAHRVISPLLEMGQHLTLLRYAVQSEGKLQGLYDEALLSEPEQAAEINEYSVCFEDVSFGHAVGWEACHTLAGLWCYIREEFKWKTPEQLVNLLSDIVALGGNLLMNIGPTARGTFEPRACEALKVYSDWMAVNGRAIYETVPSELEAPDGCRFTQKNNRLYIHIQNWPHKAIHVKKLAGRVAYAQMLHDASEVFWNDVKHDDIVRLELPLVRPKVNVPVIEVFLKEKSPK